MCPPDESVNPGGRAGEPAASDQVMGVCQLGVAALVYNWTLYALPVTASGKYGGET